MSLSRQLSRKKTEKLLLLPVNYNITIYTCPELLKEIEKNLEEPHLIKYLNQPIAEIVQYIEDITLKVTIDKRFDRATDVKDNYLFDLAYTVKSYFLVTGDHILLNMKQVNRIRVVSPSAFYYLLGEKW